MKCAYFDCFSGVSGDMILGALLDLGVELVQLEQAISQLPIKGYKLTAERVKRRQLSGTLLKVQLGQQTQPLRNLNSIQKIISQSSLSPRVQEQAQQIFQRLAEAEAKIHATTPEQVHFHEVGAVDTIIDVVGTLAGLEILGVERVIVSPLPLGRGQINCAHGQLPLPAPATLELLRGCPVYSGESEGELVTPTGAAIISSLAHTYSPLPLMNIECIGYGAGSRDYSPRPNLLRVIIGECRDSRAAETLTQIEADIDDMNPQLYGWLMERLFAAGALDVTMTPIYMKKNRPGVRLSVFTPPQLLQQMADLIFRETTTIGLRFSHIQKLKLPRSSQKIDSPWGPVAIKIAQLPDRKFKYTPEYEDCRRIAQKEGISIQEVYRRVQQLAEEVLAGKTPKGGE